MKHATLNIGLFGLLMGFLAKFLDNSPIFGILSDNLPLWIFIASLLSVRAQSAGKAALRVLLFFACMLVAYYAYTWFVLRFFPEDYVRRWAILAGVSAVLAFLLWFGQGKGLLNAAILSLPIALIASLSYSFFYTQNLVSGIELILAVILFFALPRGWRQRGRVLLLSVAFAVFLDQTALLSRIWAGL